MDQLRRNQATRTKWQMRAAYACIKYCIANDSVNETLVINFDKFEYVVQNYVTC